MIREMYAEIQKQTDKHSVSELCEIYGVSRSGYYKWLKRAGQLNRYEKTHKILDSYVLDIHSHHPMMGYRQIRDKLYLEFGWIVSDPTVWKYEPLRPGEGILHHPEGVDLMPADIQLSGMEVSLVNAMSRETILRQYLDTVKGQYSHILIDCQPSLGMLTVNALAAANRVIIPVQAEYLPAKGLEQLLQTVNKVKRQINPKLQIDGILLTMVDNRTNLPRRLPPCCERPMAAKSRCSAPRFPILSGQRKLVPRARAFLPMTPMARWPRATKI